MTRIQFACYCLIATAFMTGAMFTVKASELAGSEAHGELVVNRGGFTLMTTQTNNRNQEEVLYVLDSRNERLMVYGLNPARQRLEPLASFDVAEYIQRGLGAGSDDDGGGRSRR